MASSSLKKLGLIVWKNLLLRKRQWLVTFLEMAIPILCVFLVALLKYDGKPLAYEHLPATNYEPLNILEGKKWCAYDTKNVILFTPDNPETTEVMNRMVLDICQKGPKFLTVSPVESETVLENDFRTKWRDEYEFIGAVVFPDGLKDLRKSGPRKLSYKIRMPRDRFSDSTGKVFPKRGDHFHHDHHHRGLLNDFTRVGPNPKNEQMYVKSGFIDIQLSLDQVLAKMITNKDFTHTVSLQPIPYPEYTQLDRESLTSTGHNKQDFGAYMYFAFSLAMCFMIPSITKNVVSEKQTGISELLRLTGVPSWIQWMGWLIHVLTPQLITITLVTIFTFCPMASSGAPLELCDPFLFLVILLLYVLASIAFCFLICAILQKPVIATTVAELLWIVTITSVMFFYRVDSAPSSTLISLSMLPNFALYVLLSKMFNMETLTLDETDTVPGARWSNIHHVFNGGSLKKGENEEDLGVSNLQIMLMLLADIVLYLGLAIYLELVLPSEHGVRRPWYLFNFKRNAPQVTTTVGEVPPSPEGLGSGVAEVEMEKNEEDGVSKAAEAQSSKVLLVTTSFEQEPAGALVGVDIKNLQKRFGRDKVAVGGVSLRMFTGDIFALLGHNGAGKTTLISMLTGFFAPSGGTAVINGHDIRQDMGKARQSMGLCPQHNMLFDRLTVREQISLFGMMRGLSRSMANVETNQLLLAMNMLDKSSTLAKNLSGGQKRKLSLAMALIGGTKVVVLDEPTSGMDPQARREIWDLLLHLRGERTILLTTHFMEEADVLGDRIGIMADGLLQCCGTSTFLKKYYGAGYTLKLTLYGGRSQEPSTVNVPPSTLDQQAAPEPLLTPAKVNPAAAPILELVQNHVQGSVYKKGARLDLASNEVFLTLPAETATTSALSQLFTDLTARKEKLGIKTIGLSHTTMDEVFVKVGSLVDEEKHGAPLDDSGIDEEAFQRAPKQQKNIFVGQLLSLLVKKMIWSKRKWIQLAFMIIVPFALFAFVVSRGSAYATANPSDESVRNTRESLASPAPPLEISLKAYENPVTFYSEDGNFPSLAKVIGLSEKKSSNVVADLLTAGQADRVKYKRQHVVAAEVTSTDFKAMFNLYPYHAAPLAINLATNALLKQLDPNLDHQIKVTNHPFVEQRTSRFHDDYESHSSFYADDGKFDVPRCRSVGRGILYSLPLWCASLVPLGFLVLTANLVANPIEENICKVKQLQTMTGVSPLVYWGATFIWDFAIYTLVIFLMVIFLVLWEAIAGYTVLANGYGAVVLFLILTVYGFCSTLFSYMVSLRSSSVAGGFSLVTMVNLFLGLMLASIILSIETSKFPVWVIYVFGTLGRLFPTYSLVRATYLYGEISGMNAYCTLTACNPAKCGEPHPYLKWSVRRGQGSYMPPHENSGIGRDLMWMICMGLIYAGILMLVEFRLCGKMCKPTTDPNVFPPNIQDEDVFLEAERVNMLLGSGEVGMECLVVQNLSKSFGTFAAVSQLNFGVHYGECFGLLGVNGAGKTTAFRMITGDEMPSMGNAFGFNTSLDQNPVRFFSNIGYCPQFDAILETFTGKEMLMLFAGLRGVPFKSRGSEAMNWLNRMGLTESANAKCGRYSGGMKRRLSTAMALIGDPALILLDEPTSGVDPVSRRQFWKILDKMRESGQSIILTSHSMEECEALCARLGIMVNGQFQCFGGVQHLKNKFAQGYSLTLKLKPDLAYDTPELDAELEKIQQKIGEVFQPCELKDKHQSLMQYHLQNPSISWDSLFKTMEDVKTEFANLIEDYSVNETSLEEVFLAFARMQYPERKANVSLCKQICTCRC